MRRIGLLAFLSVITLAGTAQAQQAPPSGQQDRSNSQFSLNRNNTGVAETEAARQRARAGDCAGALPLFDTAISRGATDPTVFRDRAICHDKLGNVFPAVEDYRAYLAGAPDASDRDQIQKRLNELQPKTTSDKQIVNVVPEENLAGQGNSTVYQANREAPERKRSKFGPQKAGDPAYQTDYYIEEERLDDRADRSSLRLGRGLVIGAIGSFPRLFFGKNGVGGIGYSATGQLRYSANKWFSVMFEFGWGGVGRFRDEPRQARYQTTLSGPVMQLGIEGRVGSGRKDNQVFFRGGLGYERYTEIRDPRGGYVNMATGRFAVGFRHVFGEALGFEMGVDGGPALVFPEVGDTQVAGLAMVSFGLAFGL